ncbi:acyltransferase family protein [Kineococcus gypseus]|uniref:acyltransferase family protein n=1 Tax=Kineococcus gypseus TaxID=1637102 RepID=UPI003D7C9B64
MSTTGTSAGTTGADGVLPRPRGASASPRVAWADAGKGAAIALVVLTHATIFVEVAGHSSAEWNAFNSLIVGARMPLFFAVSGLFAASALARPWGEALRRRVVPSAWLFVVWLVVTTAFFAAGPWPDWGQADGARDLATTLVLPDTELWYLYALVLHALVALATRRLPAAVPLAGAAVLSVLVGAGWLATGSWGLDDTLANLVFFLAGVHGRRVLTALGERVRPLTTAALLVGYLLFAGVVGRLDLHLVPGVPLVRGALGTAAAVACCALLVRWWPRTPLLALGRSTLPVYVTHVLVLAALARAVRLLAPGELPGPVRLLLPPALALVAVLVGYALRGPLARVPWLMAAPAALTRRPRPAGARA